MSVDDQDSHVVAGVTYLRTSRVAEAAGVNPQTLRYYERIGLLAEPERTPGGHRMYPPEAVITIRVIKTAQRLGFNLDEIRLLLATGGGQGQGPRLPEGLAAKLAEVESKLADLEIIRQALVDAIADEPDGPTASPDWTPLSGLVDRETGD